jgi:membrane carboxypeptidase/penicillin-binding protein PbpC
MEVAEAYATLARGGVHKRATLTPGPAATGNATLAANACWQTLCALSRPDRTAAICPDAAQRNVAWKTGTSSGNRDAWCAAVTPAVTVVAWMGNRNGRGSAPLIGAQCAAPLALELAAALTPAGARWSQPESETLTSPTLAAARVPPLVITSPADGSEIAPDPDARPRASAGTLLLRVAADPQRQRLWWFADGRNVAVASSDEPASWAATPGDHEIRVVDARGRSATAHVRVRKLAER